MGVMCNTTIFTSNFEEFSLDGSIEKKKMIKKKYYYIMNFSMRNSNIPFRVLKDSFAQLLSSAG